MSPLIGVSKHQRNAEWEQPDRHSMEDGPPSLLLIHRRYGQRYHVLGCNDGSLYCELQLDFLFTHDYVDWNLLMIAIGRVEKRKWKTGVGMFQELLDLGNDAIMYQGV
jgi:hypothetical protein